MFGFSIFKDLSFKIKNFLSFKFKKNIKQISKSSTISTDVEVESSKNVNIISSEQSQLNQVTINNVVLSLDSQSKEILRDFLPENSTGLVPAKMQQMKNIASILKKSEFYIDKDKSVKPETSWIGQLFEKCKYTSEENLQDLWAKILAGKINGEGDVSIRTMSTLSDLSTEEAQLFKRLINFRLNTDYVYYEEHKMPKNFLTFGEISKLLDAGLIKHMQQTVKIYHPEKNNILGILYCHYNLRVKIDNQTIHMPSVVFSKAGVEIGSFLESQYSVEYVNCIRNFFSTKGLKLEQFKLEEAEAKELLHSLKNRSD